MPKRKLKDRNFTIYPVTGSVNEIFDGYVGRVEGRLNCASQDFKKNSEYGIVYATTPENCVVGKGTCIKACQEELKLTFATELENLNPGTTYYYRTYAKINPADKNKFSFKYEYAGASTGYGKIKKFTTAKYCHPKVTYWMLDNPCWDFPVIDTEIDNNYKVNRSSKNIFNVIWNSSPTTKKFVIDETHECYVKADCCGQTYKYYPSRNIREICFKYSSDFKRLYLGGINCYYGCYAATTSVVNHSHSGSDSRTCLSEGSPVPQSCSQGCTRWYRWNLYTNETISFNINNKFDYVSSKSITCVEGQLYAYHWHVTGYNSHHYFGSELHNNASCNSNEGSHKENEFNLHMQFLIELVPVF